MEPRNNKKQATTKTVTKSVKIQEITNALCQENFYSPAFNITNFNFRAKCRIGDYKTTALLDTGSTRSIISHYVAHRIGPIDDCDQDLYTLTNFKLKVYGSITKTIKIKIDDIYKKEVVCEILVVRLTHVNVVLGQDALKLLKISLNCGEETITSSLTNDDIDASLKSVKNLVIGSSSEDECSDFCEKLAHTNNARQLRKERKLLARARRQRQPSARMCRY